MSLFNPSYKDYISSAQHSKTAAEDYMNQYSEEDINKYLYQGAWFDCNINIKTRYMDELCSSEKAQLKLDMEIFLDDDRRHTSDYAIIYNYIMNSKESGYFISQLSERLMHANNRFTFMLAMTQTHVMEYSYYEGLVKVVLSNISDTEIGNLQAYIRGFNSFNSEEKTMNIVEQLKRKFNEL